MLQPKRMARPAPEPMYGRLLRKKSRAAPEPYSPCVKEEAPADEEEVPEDAVPEEMPADEEEAPPPPTALPVRVPCPPAPPAMHAHFPILCPAPPPFMPFAPPHPVLHLVYPGGRLAMPLQPPTAAQADLRLMMDGLVARLEAIDRSMACLRREYYVLSARLAWMRDQQSGGWGRI